MNLSNTGLKQCLSTLILFFGFGLPHLVSGTIELIVRLLYSFAWNSLANLSFQCCSSCWINHTLCWTFVRQIGRRLSSSRSTPSSLLLYLFLSCSVTLFSCCLKYAMHVASTRIIQKKSQLAVGTE